MQYTFSEIVDIPAVQTLMDNQWKTSGIPAGIVDIEGNVLVAIGWQDICTKFHRQHPETERRCWESAASITERLREEGGAFGEFIECRCRNGMIDIGVPIVIEGKHWGTIFLGQFFYEPPDVEFFRLQARNFGFDEEAYLNALEKVPIFTRQKVKEILDFNTGLVNLLTRMGVEKLRQLKAQRDLEKSEKRFRALFENSNDATYIIDPEGGILEVNKAACEQFGCSQEELLQMKVPDLLSPERAINFSNRVSEIQEKGRLIFESVHLRKDGSPFHVEVSICTFNYLGKTALLGTFRDISERKRAEEKVLRQKNLFELLIKYIPEVVIVSNKNREISFGNLALERVFGYKLEEVLGQKTAALYANEEDFHQRWAERYNVNAEEQPKPHIVNYRRKNGEIFPGETVRTVVREPDGKVIGYMGLVRDITDRMQADEALKKALTDAEAAKDKIDAIIKSVADGLIVTDLDNRIVLMNRPAEAILGICLQDVFQRQLDASIQHKYLKDQFDAIQSGRKNEALLDLELPDENRKGVRTIQARSSLVLGKEGMKAGVITILRDVSRERELDRMKSEFISTAAHELRTPLTAVRGFSELLLKEDGFDEEQKAEFLSYIYEKSEVLEKIIEDMLNLSRVESGRVIHLKKEFCDIRSIIDRQVSRYQKEFKDLRFELTVPQKNIDLLMDRWKIGQVLENILSNAVKFSPKGSLIQVNCEMAESEVRVTIRDEGIGMTPEQVEKVFDKFYRADSSNTAVGGLGLGMAIAKSIIETHNGQIWVESGLHKGTEVTFTLPRKLGADS